MKAILIKLFWPILKFFETDVEPAGYKQSHRIILIVMGGLFMVLATGSALSSYTANEMGGLIPAVVFFLVSLTAVVVGTLGSNGAVSKIWGNK